MHFLIVGLQSTAQILAGHIAFSLLLLTAGLAPLQPCAGQRGTWTETGSLITVRYNHSARFLPNGKVLVAGGTDSIGFPFASAELYDPSFRSVGSR